MSEVTYEDGIWAATMATAPARRAIEYCILAIERVNRLVIGVLVGLMF